MFQDKYSAVPHTSPPAACHRTPGLQIYLISLRSSSPPSMLTSKKVLSVLPIKDTSLLYSHPEKHWLTGNNALGVGGLEGVVHEIPCGVGLVAAQPVVDHQRVHAIVHVGGLVEEQAAVLDRAVVRVGDQLGVGVPALVQRLSVVQPADGGLWVPVHGKGEAPVVLRLGFAQEQDPHRDCLGRRE